MRTIKEASNLAGIGVYTPHYYDEIGQLKQSVLREVGYRLYGDRALEASQRVS